MEESQNKRNICETKPEPCWENQPYKLSDWTHSQKNCLHFSG